MGVRVGFKRNQQEHQHPAVQYYIAFSLPLHNTPSNYHLSYFGTARIAAMVFTPDRDIPDLSGKVIIITRGSSG